MFSFTRYPAKRCALFGDIVHRIFQHPSNPRPHETYGNLRDGSPSRNSEVRNLNARYNYILSANRATKIIKSPFCLPKNYVFVESWPLCVITTRFLVSQCRYFPSLFCFDSLQRTIECSRLIQLSE